jgi:Flp pilus assembly secretin CpaC
VRHWFAITRFATVLAFAVGHWSTTYAGSSYKLVTAPTDAKQAQAEPTVRETQGDDAQKTGYHVRREQILLPPNTERQVSFSTPFTKVVISDPDVLGVLPIGSHSVVVKAIKTGNADILFFNNEDLVRNLEVTVDYNVARRSVVPDREAYLPALLRIEIHNKSLVTSQTNYLCGVNGCQYVNEITATEPAPLPRGWSNQNINSTSPEGQAAPQVTVPATPQ